jgi:hypothetical protein
MLKATHSRTTKRFPTRELPCGFGRTLMWCSMLMLLSLGIRAASAGECLITGPQYQLQSDTVEWQLKTRIGQSCIRGIRFRNVAGPVVKIISPPSFGKLAVLGPSFSYTAGTNVADKDSFSFEVSGFISGGSGTSTVHVVCPLSALPQYRVREGRTPATRLLRRSNASMRRPWPPSANKTSGCQVG